MCGIVGIWSPHPEDHKSLDSCMAAIRHRGPDGSGKYQDLSQGISLGHQRLAILDLSNNGAQPFSSSEAGVHLVCNGEIYNYKELRKHLSQKGYQFKSESDNEVLLSMYLEYGVNMLEHINGMFAFIIWDQRSKKIFAATDRFGKKPLYYAQKEGRIVFASELKALLKFEWVGRTINKTAVDRYLALRYVPAPMTMFQEVQKLPAATMLQIDQQKKVHTKKYWQPRKKDQIVYDERAKQDFMELLFDSVSLRTQSDVPLGLYLSGGVDSSTIGHILKEIKGSHHDAYSLDVDYAYNEVDKAREISDCLGFNFHSITLTKDDFQLLPEIIYHLDEPFGDLLALPSYVLAREAKKKFSVVLTGDGADEIFAGYIHQKVMLSWQQHQYLFKRPLNTLFSTTTQMIPPKILNHFFDYPSELQKSEKNKIVHALKHSYDFGKFYDALTTSFNEFERHSLTGFNPEQSFAEEIKHQMEGFEQDGFSFLSQLGMLDLHHWIPFSLINRLDKLNMAHAVENRSPFLDYRVVEFALNLCDEGKFHAKKNKIILREAYKKIKAPSLPDNKKQAFYMPLTADLKSTLLQYCENYLTENNLNDVGIVNGSVVKNLMQEFQHPQSSMLINRKIVSLLTLAMWNDKISK